MKTMNFENLVIMHRINNNTLYMSNALAGEVGEIANCVKKLEIIKHLEDNDIEPNITFEEVEVKLVEELGDALFYLTALALHYGCPLEKIMVNQAGKLNQQSIDYGRNFLK